MTFDDYFTLWINIWKICLVTTLFNKILIVKSDYYFYFEFDSLHTFFHLFVHKINRIIFGRNYIRKVQSIFIFILNSTLRKKCYWIYNYVLYIIDSKKNSNNTDTCATNSITYWFESMIYTLLTEMYKFNSIFFSVYILLFYDEKYITKCLHFALHLWSHVFYADT